MPLCDARQSLLPAIALVLVMLALTSKGFTGDTPPAVYPYPEHAICRP